MSNQALPSLGLVLMASRLGPACAVPGELCRAAVPEPGWSGGAEPPSVQLLIPVK